MFSMILNFASLCRQNSPYKLPLY